MIGNKADKPKGINNEKLSEAVSSLGLTGGASWASITGKPLVFAPDTHIHNISDVSGLTVALAGKQAEGSYANATHTHSPSDITQDASNRFVTDTEKSTWNGKQAALVSGTNIKTINSSSILGSGNIVVGATLTTLSSKLANNVNMASTNTWYTGASVSLTAGTWIVFGTITLNRNTTTAQQYQVRIFDGTTAHASGQQYQASVTNAPVVITLHAVIILTGSATVSIQAASSTSTANTILAATLANGQGNNATQINAIKVADAAV